MLPSLLTSRLKTILGSHYDGVIASFAKNRKGSLRLNTLKTDGVDVIEEFKSKGIILEPFGSIHGSYVFDREHEYAIKGTRSFYEGKIYLQSIASQLPALVLDPQSGESILDVCAAPGSKTTQLAMIMANRGSIYAIEQNQIRYDKLLYNCALQGATIVTGVKMDARHWLSDTGAAVTIVDETTDIEFDRILLDVPCSAEGRISLDNEKTYGFWSLDNIIRKSELQGELLKVSWDHLKVGGILVYSTCTLAPEENEGVITDFLFTHDDISIESIDIGLSDRSGWMHGLASFGRNTEYSPLLSRAVRILPSDETEGFFMVKLKKV
ncbi:RsmB/NOP family class I SAM-dependent RNA methyltransferase [Candidatus Gracilibacteria bacterium]|nr:RsmB/NOP family class I SAM-dependent RNA methyltransferase [Candidatus Gracilibacteria bacterium]